MIGQSTWGWEAERFGRKAAEGIQTLGRGKRRPPSIHSRIIYEDDVAKS